MPHSRQRRRARPLRALAFVIALPVAAWAAMRSDHSSTVAARSGPPAVADVADHALPAPARAVSAPDADEIRHVAAARDSARRRWFAVVVYSALVEQARVVQQHEQMWDTLARCESGGNWNVVDRFGGGLGIYIGTWRMFDGDQFASNPGYATREQQITVAERIYDRFGLGGWGCAHELGWVR